MKFCYECGYKLEGFEKFCPECGKEFKSSKDTEHFIESIFNQFKNDIDRINALNVFPVPDGDNLY